MWLNSSIVECPDESSPLFCWKAKIEATKRCSGTDFPLEHGNSAVLKRENWQGVCHWKSGWWFFKYFLYSFYIHPKPWGRWTQFDSYFSDGLVKNHQPVYIGFQPKKNSVVWKSNPAINVGQIIASPSRMGCIVQSHSIPPKRGWVSHQESVNLPEFKVACRSCGWRVGEKQVLPQKPVIYGVK